jgi:predicted N-acetyltransferase YhbS
VTEIRPLNQIAAADVESLLDAAFGTDRHGRTAYKLRAGTVAIPSLSFAAVEGGVLVGSLQSWPVALETPSGRRAPLTLVGPVAVSPTLQRGGIGRMLMTHMLAVADAGAAEVTGGWYLPGPVERHRLLARIRCAGGIPRKGLIGPDIGRAG